MHRKAIGPIRMRIVIEKPAQPIRPPQPPARPVAAADQWDRTGAVRRARRRADVSQREMARRIGVSPATVARAECADRSVSFAVIEAILAQGGLRLLVVDEQDRPVAPMRSDAARNNGGTRYPAHLDAWIPTHSDEPLGGWRRDRPKPRLTFHHRNWRDVRRLRRCVIPRDHSVEIDLRLARHLRRRRPDWMRRLMEQHRRRIDPELCRCGPECVTNCVPECRCQCEPIGWETIDLRIGTTTPEPSTGDPGNDRDGGPDSDPPADSDPADGAPIR